MSVFNPDTFLEQQFNEANSTQMVPVPVGEYTAVIKDIKARQWQSKKDPSVAGLTLDVTWDVDSAEVRELLGRESVTVKQGIMLDLTDSGSLDFGKGRNVALGRLREALGLNTPGQAFSFAQLPGRVAKISVTHRIDGEQIYTDVKGVTAI